MLQRGWSQSSMRGKLVGNCCCDNNSLWWHVWNSSAKEDWEWLRYWVRMSNRECITERIYELPVMVVAGWSLQELITSVPSIQTLMPSLAVTVSEVIVQFVKMVISPSHEALKIKVVNTKTRMMPSVPPRRARRNTWRWTVASPIEIDLRIAQWDHRITREIPIVKVFRIQPRTTYDWLH